MAMIFATVLGHTLATGLTMEEVVSAARLAHTTAFAVKLAL